MIPVAERAYPRHPYYFGLSVAHPLLQGLFLIWTLNADSRSALGYDVTVCFDSRSVHQSERKDCVGEVICNPTQAQTGDDSRKSSLHSVCSGAEAVSEKTVNFNF